MLFTKCIYSIPSNLDGERISVMSRHTLNDGITPDLRISSNSYNRWLKILAPPDKLIGAYYLRGISFEDFCEQYKLYLSREEVTCEVKSLAKLALDKDVTLLCIEESAEKCHRKILAQMCKNYQPTLKIGHR